ncbi:hypothetical protein LSUE1_G003279 [Lachnellula suecica]|uniref:Uncharacterized protein n=1 Tax=Lachnellula suecica TaxID=602035 RepID=A0A8T9CBW7_9HELO|nr:hypothetical protein LSUE1_G003279 [Lachnellula suecica]
MHFRSVASSAIGLLAIAPILAAQLSPAAQSLFDFSMGINDVRWDDSYKFIWYNDNGPWSTRFTAWYTAGLLYRNEGNDVENAKAALKNM